MDVCNAVLFGHKNKILITCDSKDKPGKHIELSDQHKMEPMSLSVTVFNTNLHGPDVTSQIFIYHVTHSKVLIYEGRLNILKKTPCAGAGPVPRDPARRRLFYTAFANK